MLRPKPGETLLDVGCGTGYFTRRFAGESGLRAVGLDPNVSWLDFARAHGAGNEQYCAGRAESLPFSDCRFDLSGSFTAWCFIEDPRPALQQILRVTRKRFAGASAMYQLIHASAAIPTPGRLSTYQAAI